MAQNVSCGPCQLRLPNAPSPLALIFDVSGPDGIILVMANQAYLSVWRKNFSEPQMLEQLGKFLETVPSSTTRPGFTYLVVSAVDPTETPILEQDLRAVPIDSELNHRTGEGSSEYRRVLRSSRELGSMGAGRARTMEQRGAAAGNICARRGLRRGVLAGERAYPSRSRI